MEGEGCRRVASSLVVAGAFTQSSLAPHSLLQPREADFARNSLSYYLHTAPLLLRAAWFCSLSQFHALQLDLRPRVQFWPS
jgi:hypothetical protein